MRVQLDAVVNEYVLDTLEEISEKNLAPYQRERAFIKIVEALIVDGLISHRYDPSRQTDEFHATRSLTRKWRRDFPELEDHVDPTETITIDIGKDNSRYKDGRRQIRKNGL
jgi:hypothetical protein